MEPRTSRPCRNRRLPAAVLMGGLTGISLLTFPAHLLLMVAVWLILHGLLVRAGRPGWMPLLACVAIVLIKGSAWLPAVVLLLAVLAGVGMFRLAGHLTGRIPPASATNITLALLWLAWLVAGIDTWLAARTTRRPALDPQRPVVCLGDSLTAYHPNARGNKRLARQVCHAMQRIYGPQIRR